MQQHARLQEAAQEGGHPSESKQNYSPAPNTQERSRRFGVSETINHRVSQRRGNARRPSLAAAVAAAGRAVLHRGARGTRGSVWRIIKSCNHVRNVLPALRLAGAKREPPPGVGCRTQERR